MRPGGAVLAVPNVAGLVPARARVGRPRVLLRVAGVVVASIVAGGGPAAVGVVHSTVAEVRSLLAIGAMAVLRAHTRLGVA